MAKRFETDKPTIAEIRALRKPRTITVRVPLDLDLLRQAEELERKIRVAEREDERLNRAPVAPQLKVELEELAIEAERAAVDFVFQELPRKRYRALLEAHPTDDATKRWNEETFEPALVSACCIEPEMNANDAEALAEEWGEVIWQELFAAAWAVNEAPPKIPFIDRPIGQTQDSPQSSTTAPSEE